MGGSSPLCQRRCSCVSAEAQDAGKGCTIHSHPASRTSPLALLYAALPPLLPPFASPQLLSALLLTFSASIHLPRAAFPPPLQSPPLRSPPTHPIAADRALPLLQFTLGLPRESKTIPCGTPVPLFIEGPVRQAASRSSLSLTPPLPALPGLPSPPLALIVLPIRSDSSFSLLSHPVTSLLLTYHPPLPISSPSLIAFGLGRGRPGGLVRERDVADLMRA